MSAISDPLGDMLTRIRNSQMRGRSTVRSPDSKLRRWVLDVLREEGFIRSYERIEPKPGKGEIEISLKYSSGAPAIREAKRVSRPGKRVYSSVSDLPAVRQGLGVAIVSTSHGVMSDASARAANVGGEVLCTVF